MASVLTDQVLRAKLMSPLTGFTAATPRLVQFATVPPFGQSGNALIAVPAEGRVTGNPFRVVVSGSLNQTVTGTITVALLLDGVALASTIVPTATGLRGFSAYFDFLFVNATTPLAGQASNWSNGAPVAATTISAVTVDLTVPGHVPTLTITDSATDAATVVAVTEFALEVR